jgi:excisionase family DNA binding protein
LVTQTKESTAAIELHPTSLKVNEISEFLRVSRSHVYELMRAGHLVTSTVGNARRISRESFDQYLEEIGWYPSDDY